MSGCSLLFSFVIRAEQLGMGRAGNNSEELGKIAPSQKSCPQGQEVCQIPHVAFMLPPPPPPHPAQSSYLQAAQTGLHLITQSHFQSQA